MSPFFSASGAFRSPPPFAAGVFPESPREGEAPDAGFPRPPSEGRTLRPPEGLSALPAPEPFLCPWGFGPFFFEDDGVFLPEDAEEPEEPLNLKSSPYFFR